MRSKTTPDRILWKAGQAVFLIASSILFTLILIVLKSCGTALYFVARKPGSSQSERSLEIH